MFPSDMMVKERMADRMREADADRRSRPLVEARASARRAVVRDALSAALALVVQRPWTRAPTGRPLGIVMTHDGLAKGSGSRGGRTRTP
jgi:hypothetical protein